MLSSSSFFICLLLFFFFVWCKSFEMKFSIRLFVIISSWCLDDKRKFFFLLWRVFHLFFGAQLQCFQHINRHIFHSSFQDPSINRTMMMMKKKIVQRPITVRVVVVVVCFEIFTLISGILLIWIDWFDSICSLQMLIFEP